MKTVQALIAVLLTVILCDPLQSKDTGWKFPINRGSTTEITWFPREVLARDQLPIKRVAVGRTGMPGSQSREELLRLFALWQAQYAVSETGELTQKEPFATAELVRIKAPVRQHAGGSLYLVAAGTKDEGEVIMVQPSPGVEWTDGEWLNTLAFRIGVKDWQTVLGASRRSPLYQSVDLARLVAHDKSPSKDVFTAQLKAGETFSFIGEDISSCRKCVGRGEYSGRAEKGQNPDRTFQCEACEGTGRKRELVIYQLSW